MKLSKSERIILEFIKQNPFCSGRQIADSLYGLRKRRAYAKELGTLRVLVFKANRKLIPEGYRITGSFEGNHGYRFIEIKQLGKFLGRIEDWKQRTDCVVGRLFDDRLHSRKPGTVVHFQRQGKIEDRIETVDGYYKLGKRSDQENLQTRSE